jgi:hypothetical protein
LGLISRIVCGKEQPTFFLTGKTRRLLKGTGGLDPMRPRGQQVGTGVRPTSVNSHRADGIPHDARRGKPAIGGKALKYGGIYLRKNRRGKKDDAKKNNSGKPKSTAFHNSSYLLAALWTSF